MRILIFTSLFPGKKGGSNGTFNVDRVNALTRAGHDVSVIVVKPFPIFELFIKLITIFQLKNVSLIQQEWDYPLYISEEKIFRYFWLWLPKKLFIHYEHKFLHFFIGKKIKKVVNIVNPELILSSWLHPFGTYAQYIKKYYVKKYFSIIEGSDLLEYYKLYPKWKQILPTLNQNVDKFILVSSSLKESVFINDLGAVAIINNGFNQNLFNFIDCFDGFNKIINIISVGSLIKIKGHDLLIDAMSFLPEGFKLTIIGSGPLYSSYQNIINNRSLNHRINLVGEKPINKIPDLLRSCDIFCIPSRSESFGIALYEAMGCGLPAITSDIPAFNQIIVNGVNGILFESGSVNSLVFSIIASTKIIWNRRKISENVIANYSWDIWSNNIISLSSGQ